MRIDERANIQVEYGAPSLYELPDDVKRYISNLEEELNNRDKISDYKRRSYELCRYALTQIVALGGRGKAPVIAKNALAKDDALGTPVNWSPIGK